MSLASNPNVSQTKHRALLPNLGAWIIRRTPLRRHPVRCFVIVSSVLASLSPRPARAATYEFEGPYAVREFAQGLALEISGTFSWALPQEVGIALAQTPGIRVIHLDSPGGHIKAAIEVADLIRAHNLDTYVSHMCASACTVAFLAGHHRFVSETARLGFHQAYGAGLSIERSNLLLLRVYQRFRIPPTFIAHILRTPSKDLWIPDLAELRKAGIVTAIAPNREFDALDFVPSDGCTNSAARIGC